MLYLSRFSLFTQLNRREDRYLSKITTELSAVVVEGLQERGWACMPEFLDREEGLALATEGMAGWEDGNFRQAGVGRGENKVIREDIRGDHVRWLEPDSMGAAEGRYLERLEGLRLAINQPLLLGLFGFEGHFAVYQPGAFYKPHLDRHRETSDRVVTVILYLNDGWKDADGGQLRLWTTPGDKVGESVILQPQMGTVVAFLAGDHWHEVLPARETRMSITGWFRVREG
jgi:SM-20-related protein